MKRPRTPPSSPPAPGAAPTTTPGAPSGRAEPRASRNTCEAPENLPEIRHALGPDFTPPAEDVSAVGDEEPLHRQEVGRTRRLRPRPSPRSCLREPARFSRPDNDY